MTEPTYTPAPAADFVLPFDLPKVHVRGRLVRLDEVSTAALANHKLPELAQRSLADALAMNALLGSALKLEGRLSIQTQSDGPMNLVATDYFAHTPKGPRGLRGYARLAKDAREAKDFAALTGKGVLAITIENKPGESAYQGMVPLAAEGFAVSAESYFKQSEQLPTLIRLASGPVLANHKKGWRAGGLMVQAVPGSEVDVQETDDWKRIEMFMQTLEDVELLDTSIRAEDVLWRLFHEDEIRVQPAQSLHFHCGCDAERLEAVLKSYPEAERSTLADADGVIRARCEFCGTTYEFGTDAL